MSNMEYYENVGDNLVGYIATRAYHVAQGHAETLADTQRIQQKICKALEYEPIEMR